MAKLFGLPMDEVLAITAFNTVEEIKLAITSLNTADEIKTIFTIDSCIEETIIESHATH
jgi:hypothetical protein